MNNGIAIVNTLRDCLCQGRETEAALLLNKLEKELLKNEFMVEKLERDKQITEGFLNKTIEDLEQAYNDLKAYKQVELAQKEKTIRTQESQLKQVIDTAPAFSMAFVDMSGIYKMVSSRYLEWLDKARKDIIGKRTIEILGEKLYEELRPFFYRAMSGEQQEFEFVTKNLITNKPIFFQVYYVPAFDDEQKQIGAYIYTQDITNLKEKEQALAASEAKYKILFEKSPFHIIQSDIRGHIQLTSPMVLEEFKYTKSEVIGTQLSDFVATEHHHLLREGLESFEAGNEEYELKFKGVDKDKNIHYMEGLSAPIRNAKGEIRSIITMFADSTKRYQAEKELKESKELFEKLYENMFEPTLIYDFEKETITDCNAATIDILGYNDKEELLGKSATEFTPQFVADFPGVDLHQRAKEVGTDIRKGLSIRISSIHVNKDGEMFKGKMSIIPTYRHESEVFIIFQDLTKSINRKKALKISNERYKILVEASPLGISLNSLEGKRLFVSEQTAELFGYESTDQMVKESIIREHVVDGSLESWWAEIIAANGENMNTLFECRRKDGSIFSCDLNARIINDGGVQKILAIYNDVTEQEKTRKALAEREALLSSILESITDIVWAANLDGEIISINTIAQESSIMEFGINPQVGDSLIEKYGSNEKLYKLWRPVYEIVENGKIFNFSYQSKIDPKGKSHFMDIVMSPIKNEDGIITGTIGIARNVTKLKEQEKALIESKATLQALINSIPFGVYAIDTDLRVIYANEKAIKDAKQYWGYDIYTGCNFKDCIPEKVLKDWKKRFFDRVFAGYPFRSIGGVDQLSKQNIVMDNRYTPVIDDEKNIIGCLEVAIDITEISNARKTLTEKNEELQKYIESNLQLENFAYIASHDLKAPLSNILNFSALLKEQISSLLNEDQKLFLEYLTKSAENMDETITALFNFSQTSNKELEFSEFNPKTTIVNLIQGIKSTVKETQTSIKIGTFPMKISADQVLFRQLIQNLLLNGIKFVEEEKIPEIVVRGIENADHWEFQVQDNGIGIRPEFKEKIFLLFKRLHNQTRFKGTGIGLATCKKIAEFHNGKIWVESKLGEGSTFYFTISKNIINDFPS